jgi:hypothetical protein
MEFDPSALLGPLGGALGIAFAAGSAAGYAFCVRTVYKLLGEGNNKLYDNCLEHCKQLQDENDDLRKRALVLEERLYFGQTRQLEQIRDSSVTILGRDKLAGGIPPREDE